MSKSTKIVTLSCLLAACISTQTAATTLPVFAPGTKYRLAFVTNGTTPATSTNIGTYDTFVTNAANAVPVLAALGATWEVLGSTAADNVKTHTGVDDTPAGPNGVPIYLLDAANTKIADNYDDVWDNTLDAPFDVTELGTVLSSGIAWTGTFSDGTTAPTQPLGAADVRRGDIKLNFAGLWVSGGFTSNDASNHLYAVSEELTAVPEPSTFLLLLGGVVLLGYAWRR